MPKRAALLNSVCVQAGVFTAGGHHEENTLYAGDAGYAPMSSAHWFKNVGSTDSYIVLIFNAGQLTNLEATALVANMPAEVSNCSRSALSLFTSFREHSQGGQVLTWLCPVLKRGPLPPSPQPSFLQGPAQDIFAGPVVRHMGVAEWVTKAGLTAPRVHQSRLGPMPTSCAGAGG